MVSVSNHERGFTQSGVKEMARKEELPANEAGQQRLFELLPDAILVSDTEGRIVRVNSQAEAMFGYSREELLGQPIDLLVPEPLREHSSRVFWFWESSQRGSCQHPTLALSPRVG